MKIRVELPIPSWSDEAKEQIYKSIQSAPELGMVYKAALKDLVKANSMRGSCWGIYVDDILRGACIVGSRALYQHMARHGDIAVQPEFRRNRLGTCMYTVQFFQAILEGRRYLEDTIVPALSPWMAGPTNCGGGFLNALKYDFLGTMPQRSRSFKDIQLWGKEVTSVTLQDYLTRIPKDVIFDLRDTPVVRETFQKNLECYEKHKPELAKDMLMLRDWLFKSDLTNITVVSDLEQIKDAGGNWKEVKIKE